MTSSENAIYFMCLTILFFLYSRFEKGDGLLSTVIRLGSAVLSVVCLIIAMISASMAGSG